MAGCPGTEWSPGNHTGVAVLGFGQQTAEIELHNHISSMSGMSLTATALHYCGLRLMIFMKARCVDLALYWVSGGRGVQY